MFDRAELVGGVAREVGAVAEVAAHEAVAVLVGGALRGGVRLCKVDVDPGQLGERCVACHFAALLPSERAAQRCGDAFDDLDESGQGGARAVALGHVCEPQMAAGPVEHDHQRGRVAGTDDQVSVMSLESTLTPPTRGVSM